ncbi:MAG TPA: low temperature requirement protein A [Streptomyces sp.]|nr:low temperature requirement protein A [Streptomyces sp.]
MTSTTPPAAGSVRRMTSRNRHEEHRPATPLELFFDLCFVVAIAQAGARLVHALAEGHVGSGILGYTLVFFAVWWAWMNFTWFASAYDTDDALYRVVTLVQIAGVLVMAAGIPEAFDHGNWTVCVIGYVVMRLALTSQWLRAAHATDGPERRTACLYAAGVTVCQLAWISVLFVPDGVRVWCFAAVALAELSVPALAERGYKTSWHPHHIVERYGLLTNIVLGESIAAATVAVQEGFTEHDGLAHLLPIAGGGLLLVFAAWWIYFAAPVADRLTSMRASLTWGYGHLLIFGSAAAIGAGLEVAVEQSTGKAHISAFAASAAVTVPAALYLLTVWFLHSRHSKRGTVQQLILPVSALAVLGCTFAGQWAVLAAGLVAALTVALGVTLSTRDPAPR